MQAVRDIMTPDPLTIERTLSVVDAARIMRSSDIGDVIVCDHGKLYGVLTDRDIVVRAVAEGRDPSKIMVAEVCSCDLITVDAETPAEQAVTLMRENAIRRIPVIEDGMPIGIVTLGDLALERDPSSALADVSAAPPNR